MSISVTSKMPTNCGMAGMHGNGVKKATEQNTFKINSVANEQSMPAENMYQSSSTNPVQVANTIDEIPNLETTIAIKEVAKSARKQAGLSDELSSLIQKLKI